jgi:hypothetical protein
MNLNKSNQETTTSKPTRMSVCLASCKKLLAQIRKTKGAIFAEFHDAFQKHEHLLHLALNEAEALAWETDYPHLIFPTLATEKAHALASWNTHQGSVQRATSPRALNI